MKKDTMILSGTNSQPLFTRRYEDETVLEKKGVVQILHGMAEYGDRYDGFANFLCANGYIVYIHDHRKHGKSIGAGQKVGYFDTDTWTEMVNDVELVKREILKKEQVNEVIMIGHSMGSFLLRNFLMDFGNNVTKAVIIGTGSTDVLLSKIGVIIGKAIGLFAPNKPSVFLNNLSVGKYGKVFKPNRTGLEWLTRDEAIVDWYDLSPLCGYSYTPKFYYEIAAGLIKIVKPENILKTPKIPLYFTSGQEDPVGNQGEGVKRIVFLYKELGYDTTLHLYKDARHEILNELNKEEVYNDILTFIG